jgi:hypothetical protein
MSRINKKHFEECDSASYWKERVLIPVGALVILVRSEIILDRKSLV